MTRSTRSRRSVVVIASALLACAPGSLGCSSSTSGSVPDDDASVTADAQSDGPGTGPEGDAGTDATASDDASPGDATLPDAAVVGAGDSGTVDASVTDAGSSDGGVSDAAPGLDAAPALDAGFPDQADAATAFDAAAADATSPDAAGLPADAGLPPDGGTTGPTGDGGCTTGGLAITNGFTPGGSLGITALCGVYGGSTTAQNSPQFTLMNTGSTPIAWTASVSSTYFSVDNAGSVLAPGDSVTVTVSAVALASSPPGTSVADVVVVTEDDAPGCPLLLPVTESFSGYFFSPASLDFGDVPVGQSASLHVSASFVGNVGFFAGVLSAGPTPEFSGSANTPAQPVSGVDVVFTPETTGLRTGSVTFVGFQTPICTPMPIPATGTGTPAPPPICASLAQWAACATGAVCVGTACEAQLRWTGQPSLTFVPGTALTATVGSFGDVLTGDSSSAFTATIDWGDGNTSTGTVAGSAGSFSVAGTHTYTSGAIVTGGVTVTDAATGNTAAGSISAGPQIAVATFPLSGPLSGIVTGPDGDLWLPNAGSVSQVTTAGAAASFDDFAVDSSNALSQTEDIAVGADGNLWFPAGAKIGRITTAGVTAAFVVPSGTPGAVTAGPDGNVWFTEPGADRVGFVTPAGIVTEFAVPAGSVPFGIATGGDGNVWFAEVDRSKIGRMTTAGTLTEFDVVDGGEPKTVIAGPDGDVWFVDYAGTTISRVAPDGGITPFTIPGNQASGDSGVAVGSDGNLWVTSGAANRLARVTTAGVVSVFTVPASHYLGITAGSDGNLWATDHVAGVIARITPP